MGQQNSVSLWIEAIRTGDEQAAFALWDRYFRQLMHVARDRMQAVPRATYDEEDVAVSTFRVLCQKLRDGHYPQLDNRDALWKVMLTVLIRKVLGRVDYEKADKRGPTVSLSSGVEAVQREDLSILVAEECEHLLTQLDDELLKNVVALKLDGFSNEDIASQLGKSLRTVQRMLTLIRGIWMQEIHGESRPDN